MIRKILVPLLAACLLLSGCSPATPAEADMPGKPPAAEVQPSEKPTASPSIQGQLIAMADTQEDAEEIAKLYEIQLLSYSNGVALFYTEEDTDAVIARGLANDWPALSKNSVSHTSSAY